MWIVIALVVPILVAFILLYNRFVRSRNLVREAWSGIDVQLKRRYDLIPNIVQTVKGYAAHEKQLLEEVTAMRAKNVRIDAVPERGAAENAVTGMLKRLFALVENYPQLKADKNFLDLQRQLAVVEDEIQMARRYYNGTVRDYNIRCESFPAMIVAAVAGFKPADYFEIDYATERKAPEVAL